MTEPRCAVVDCERVGRPQVCPYDGRYHHHGRIHYENGHPWHPSLVFRHSNLADGWPYVCDVHYAEIIAGRAANPPSWLAR